MTVASSLSSLADAPVLLMRLQLNGGTFGGPMTPQESAVHVKTVALALYQIRSLLTGYLGSQNEGDPVVRQAAHLAYALHNEALALIEGGAFDPPSVARRLETLDHMLGSKFAEAFRPVLTPSVS